MKIYSIKYTGASASLPKGRAALTIAAGKMLSVQVPLCTEGVITRAVLKQTSGTAVGCKIRLLDSKVPYPPGVYNAGTAAVDTVEIYEIVPQQTLTSGTALSVIDNEFGYAFHNQDGTFTDNQRFIYVILEPQAAATSTTWTLALTARSDVG